MITYCEFCGRKLNPKEVVELELDRRTNTYRLPGEIPLAYSQGIFSFGKDCAAKMLKLEEARRGEN
jgi:hypothetical protein